MIYYPYIRSMKCYIVLFVLGIIFFGTSCKKNYKCVCTATSGTVEYPINESKKKHAESTCDTYQKQWSGSLSGTCVLQAVAK